LSVDALIKVAAPEEFIVAMSRSGVTINLAREMIRVQEIAISRQQSRKH
jgi:hypothetical protein